jgi:uncharacterized protein
MESIPFWKTKKLAEMTPEEWESLCDGCCLCCLYKLEDIDSQEIYYTNVVCRLLDTDTFRCTAYLDRTVLMPTCLKLTPDLVTTLKWLPRTCAYRRISEGKDLASWHPLVSGDPQSIHRARISIRGRFILEDHVDMENLEDYVVNFFG